MAIDPIIGGTLISGAGSLLGGIANIFGRKAADRRAIRFWNMQNEYNSPQQQMARLRAAGLNPNLVYGQGAKGATGTAGAIQAPQREAFDDPFQNIGAYQDIRTKQAGQTNMEASALLQNQRALSEVSDRASAELQRAVTASQEQRATELHGFAMDAQLENVRQLRHRNRGMEIQNMVDQATAAPKIEAALNRVDLLKSQLTGQELINALRDLEIDLNKQGLTKGDNLIFRVMARRGLDGFEDSDAGKWLSGKGQWKPLSQENRRKARNWNRYTPDSVKKSYGVPTGRTNKYEY